MKLWTMTQFLMTAVAGVALVACDLEPAGQISGSVQSSPPPPPPIDPPPPPPPIDPPPPPPPPPPPGGGALNTYYVDSQSGNDGHDGKSPSTAWKTLAKVSSVTFQPREQILLKAGAIWNEKLVLKGSGTEGSPIVLDMYGGEGGAKPIINGGGGSNAEPAVLLQNEQYWEINNLEITHTNGQSGYQSDLWAIRVNATTGGEFKHVYIRNCDIHGVNGDVATKTTGGIYVTVESGTSSPAWYDDLRIQNNRIRNVGGLGIATQSTHGSIKNQDRRPFLNVLVEGNIVGPTGRNNIIIRVSDDAIVQHNRLIDSSIHDNRRSFLHWVEDQRGAVGGRSCCCPRLSAL